MKKRYNFDEWMITRFGMTNALIIGMGIGSLLGFFLFYLAIKLFLPS